jgi:hypothetical protein
MAKQPLTPDQLVRSVRGSARGSHQSALPDSTLKLLKEFATYLVEVEGKSSNTARAYKSWVAKALVERGAHDSHVKSAVQALARYRNSK